MKTAEILYISGSAGLGHVTRDLAIARELRRRIPGVAVSWLAARPASDALREAGETLLPEADEYADETLAGDAIADAGRLEGRPFHLNLVAWITRIRGDWKRNIALFRQVVQRRRFDVIVGDEAYEILLALRAKRVPATAPFVMIYDFVGADAMSRSPLERLAVWILNWRWQGGRDASGDLRVSRLFIGEPEDVPDRPFGWMLPSRREWARAYCRFLGYVLPFDPSTVGDRNQLRRKLSYGPEPLVICSVGGTGVGLSLLELCAAARAPASARLPGVRFVLVGGPRLTTGAIRPRDGVEFRGYVPGLWEHFAACDLAIVQGGGTTTLELTALRRPFLYFPLEDHFEQQFHVAARLERHRAGVRMRFLDTTPERLADEVVANLGRDPTWPPIPTDGARVAADVVAHLL